MFPPLLSSLKLGEARIFNSSCAMASRENKGKEVVTSSKEFKRLRKRVAPSSSIPRAPLLGGLEQRLWRSMDSNGSMPKKKSNMPR
ncbi:hypothetical protein HAX54_028259 [Datura stramonium]|uniref:Uncharacterized protein n=1 Tax=Datura stramonium TaxID=4076 RepID=A0ABS8V6M7_DATST|nr:hypothetical protein [Datura stramonium]